MHIFKNGIAHVNKEASRSMTPTTSPGSAVLEYSVHLAWILIRTSVFFKYSLSLSSLSVSLLIDFFFEKIELFSLALMLFWVKGSIAQQLLHNTERCSVQSPNSCVLQSHSCLWIQNWFIWCLEGEKHRLHHILDMPSPLLSEGQHHSLYFLG